MPRVGQAMDGHAEILCRHCRRAIYATGETFYGGGWIHQRTNRERCESAVVQVAEPEAPWDP